MGWRAATRAKGEYPVLKKLTKADETWKADLPNPPESPTGVFTTLALVGVALIFLASIGER